MSYFTIGTDTELFAVDKTGKHKALCGLIGGTKEKPLPMAEGLPTSFAIQEDNVAVEFNIPPCDNLIQFINYIKIAKNEVNKRLENLGLSIASECAVSFDKSELVHPTALLFGCEPDYDAWKMIENSKPITSDDTLRTAGGHIHVGNKMDMVRGVQNMDLFLGVPSVILDTGRSSTERRKLYGKAGAMRPKPYGWEYRVLSNFWVFDENLVNWVFKATEAALNYKHKFTKKEAIIIQDCINTGDIKSAEGLVKHYGLIMP